MILSGEAQRFLKKVNNLEDQVKSFAYRLDLETDAVAAKGSVEQRAIDAGRRAVYVLTEAAKAMAKARDKAAEVVAEVTDGNG